MSDLAIRNWSAYQHYGDRSSVPWIKYYIKLLNDKGFFALTEPTRLIWCLLLLVAARRANEIPDDPIWMAREVKMSVPKCRAALKELKAGGFLVSASDQSDSEQGASDQSASTADSELPVSDEVASPLARARSSEQSRREEKEQAEQSVSVVRPAALPDESLEQLGARLVAGGQRAPYGSVDAVYEVIDKPASNTRRELEKWLALLPPQLVEHVREQVLAVEPRKSKAAYAVGTAQRLAQERGAA